MKTLFLAVSALALIAAPAMAADGSSSIVVNGSVAGMCGAGHQSGGGVVTGNTPVDLGNLVDANGQLSVAATTLQFDNLWCNGPATLRLSATALSNATPVLDAGSFVNTLDMTVSGKVVDTYMGGGSATTGTDKVANTGFAFETGTGQYAQGTLNVSLPAGHNGDRPIAGAYTGTVTLTASPAP